MLINAPVYSDDNGLHNISIYAEDEDGSFRRTQNEPLRMLRDDIKGISPPQGELVSSTYDRQQRTWGSATVTFHYGKPQSFYQFIRYNISKNRFFVFTKPVLAGHITKFSVHELQLKPSTSRRKIALLKEKYLKALGLWTEEEHEKQIEEEKQRAKAKAKVKLQTGRKQTTAQVIPISANAGTEKAAHNRAQRNLARSAQQQNAAEQRRRNLKNRQNLVKDFKLDKTSSKATTVSNPQNEHFLKRFLFTVD